MNSPAFPDPPAALPATPIAECDARLQRLADRKDAWLKVDIQRRIAYLEQCLAGVEAVAEAWVRDGCRLKGIPLDDVYAGEEWLAGPMTTFRGIRTLIDALRAGGQPKPVQVSKRPDGQIVAQVFPTNAQDKILFTGFVGEVWIEPGKPATQGRIYRERPTKGKVNLTLGAGNVSSIGPLDVIYKLFVEDEVVILKMNPVNEHVGPKIEQAFKALIDDGFLAVVYGGADVGAHLTDHPLVETLHVTGSDRTYDAIVWGSDPAEQARRKAAREPVNVRPFSAELGCVTPVIVVPGPWSEADLRYQARHVAGMVAQNGSFNCNAAKVVVLAKGWPQRESFLNHLREALRSARPRKAYYPGAEARYRAFLAQYPQAETLGQAGPGVVPWTFIPGVPARKGEYALTNEAFCGVLAEVSLDAADEASFMPEAARFCNDDLWGTLSCMVLIHPKSQKGHAAAFDKLIADLRYGGVAVNCWAGVIYGLMLTTWGAFPGHTPQDIQSGAGVVHNSYLFDHPQKSVVYAPFRISPTPVWFADHRNLAAVGARLGAYERAPSWGRLFGVVAAALRA